MIMVNLMRRSALMALAAVSLLLILAPSAHARFPIHFPVRMHEPSFFSSPFRSNLIIRDRGNIFRDRSNISRDQVNLFSALRTGNTGAASRDRSALIRDGRDLFRDQGALIRDGGSLWRTGTYPFNGYMYGGGSYGGGGGYGGYGGGGYGGGYGVSQMDASEFLLNQQPSIEEPANIGMQIDWPLGLRVLPPEARELRLQVEGLLQVAENQSTTGKVDPKIIDQTVVATRKLRGLLGELAARDRVAPNTIAEARDFLDRLQDGLRMLQ